MSGSWGMKYAGTRGERMKLEPRRGELGKGIVWGFKGQLQSGTESPVTVISAYELHEGRTTWLSFPQVLAGAQH